MVNIILVMKDFTGCKRDQTTENKSINTIYNIFEKLLRLSLTTKQTNNIVNIISLQIR